MSVVFFKRHDNQLINAESVVSIFPGGLAELSTNREVKLVMDVSRKHPVPVVAVEFGGTYVPEEELRYITSAIADGFQTIDRTLDKRNR